MQKHVNLRQIASRAFVVLPVAIVLMTNANTLAAFKPTTAASPFALGSSTQAIVTSYSPLIGDNGDFPSTTASIYNLFGAGNTSVENNEDIIFADSNVEPNAVHFTTPSPVSLSGIAVYLTSDDGELNGPRSVGTFTFNADGIDVISTAPVNQSIAVNGGLNVFMFSSVVTASTFIATFTDNPNLNFTPNASNDGVGPRVYELDGIPVPEPASLGVLSVAALGLLSTRRRPNA